MTGKLKKFQNRSMKRRVPKKVFYRGPGKNSVSLVLPDRMRDSLAKLAEDLHETLPGTIYQILEIYLIEEGIDGNVPWPDDVDKAPYKRD